MIYVFPPRSKNFTKMRGNILKELQLLDDVFCLLPNLHESPSEKYNLSDLGIGYMSLNFDRKHIKINDFKNFIVLAKIRYGILLTYSIKPAVISGLAAIFSPKVCRIGVFTGTGDLEYKLDRSGIFRFISRLAFRNLDILIFQNQSDKQLFSNFNLINKNAKACIVGSSGINKTPAKLVNFGAVSELNVAFVGRVSEQKGFDFLVHLVHESDKLPEINLKFHVYGEIDPDMENVVNNFLASNERIKFYGFVVNPEQIWSDIDVVINLSDREGAPRSLLEGMMAGIVPIAFDVVGVNQIIENERNGILVPYGDVKALAQALGFLGMDRARLKSYSNLARSYAIKIHSSEKIMGQFRDIISSEVKNRKSY